VQGRTYSIDVTSDEPLSEGSSEGSSEGIWIDSRTGLSLLQTELGFGLTPDEKQILRYGELPHEWVENPQKLYDKLPAELWRSRHKDSHKDSTNRRSSTYRPELQAFVAEEQRILMSPPNADEEEKFGDDFDYGDFGDDGRRWGSFPPFLF